MVDPLRQARFLLALEPEWVIEFEDPVHLLHPSGDRIVYREKYWVAVRRDGTEIRSKTGRLVRYQHATSAARALEEDRAARNRKILGRVRRR